MNQRKYLKYNDLQIKHLVLNYNGTLAYDGQLLPGVKEELQFLAKKIQIHIIIDNTFGDVRPQIEEIPCEVINFSSGKEDEAKLNYLKGLGSEFTVCVGNGRSDRLMLKEAKVGIAIISKEGAAAEAVTAADERSTDILSVLNNIREAIELPL